MAPSIRSRKRGALVGTLAGDALLAVYETAKTSTIAADLFRRGKLMPFDYVEPFQRKRKVEKGHPTDDSELAAALGYGLLADTFDRDNIYLRLRDFIHGNHSPRKSVLTDGEAYGSGGTLRSALREPTYADSMQAFREGEVIAAPTNGSLMRNMPVALRYKTEDVAEYARKQSCITHIHPSAQVACMAHALLGSEVLNGLKPLDAWNATKEHLRVILDREKKSPNKIRVEALEAVIAMKRSMPTEAEIWPNTGEALISFRIALAAFIYAEDFYDGILKIVFVGGDTDTYGAIAGGLLGAHFGYEGIPKEWRDALIGRKIMIDIADKLHEKSLTA